MTVHHGRVSVRSRAHVDTVEITEQVLAEVRRSKIRDGLCTISVLHTTAGVFVNENADPDVPRDLLASLECLVPEDATYRHAEGNSPGHIKSVITGSTVTLAVRGGALELGRWQGVYLAEFDGPRDRSATITCIGETQV
ncbi:MAG: secondary thiamine-phosphate synthase enzyme YjbQ [Candidatus Limnocylindria bacterium]